MAKTNVYVDGFNLYYGIRGRFPDCKWLDLAALCGRLFPNRQIGRIRYFTAMVSARPGDPQQPIRQQTYIRALKTIPNLSDHYGSFRTRRPKLRLAKPPPIGPKKVTVLKTEEKGSDVNLASYMLLDAFKGDCSEAVVISNDADLKTPIELARKELGITVGVVNPHPPKKRSLDLKPDFFRQLRRGPVAASQFPATLRDAKGAIHKPASW